MTVFGLILLSLVGLGYLAWADPKRRRTFRQPRLDRRRLLWPARAAVFAPGLLLIALAHWSGLAIWAGAVTVLGWIMAAVSPDTYGLLVKRANAAAVHSFARLRLKSRTVLEKCRTAIGWPVILDLTGVLRRIGRTGAAGTSPDAIPELKARIVALEARLHRLENRPASQNASGADTDADVSAPNTEAQRRFS